jgi:putative ABC transport system permease protein
MDSFLRDVRHAARSLARTPGFALVTILTLALGIGANTAIFSVYISSQFPSMGFDQFWVSPPEYLELQERARAFSAIGAFAIGQVNLSAADRPRRVQAALASADLFKALGVSPREGRVFDAAETRPGGAQVVILSYELWQSAFGGRSNLVGQQVDVDGVRRTIVGVMPARYDVADQHVEAWLPLVLDPANRRNRANHYLYLIGRLANGATTASARAELDTMLRDWQRSITGMDNPPREQRVHTPDTQNHRLRYDPLQAQIVGGSRTSVWVLQGAVVFVLLIACANLANLLLARAESRHKEFAVRAALGAGRARLLRQFMIEGCLLSLTGAALGLFVAFGGVRALIAAYPDSLPRSAEVTIDAGVLAFTLLVALATGAVFGLAPLLHLAPQATAMALKEGGQRTTSGRQRLRRGLVVAEIGLAVALVIGAGLLLRTVLNLTRVDGGFARGQLVTFLVDLPSATYKTPPQIVGFYSRLADRLRTMPGVQSVAAMSGLPPARQVNANDTDIDGYKAPPTGPFENIDYYQVATPGYVETMGIPVVEGRTFQPSDAIGPKVVMINQTMARTFYGAQSPIGRRVRPSASASANVPWFTIVGVLKDVKQGGVDKKTGTELYFDFEQLQDTSGFTPAAMNIVVRTPLAPDALAAGIRQFVAEQDPALPVVKLRAMDDVFAEAIGRPRLVAQLLGIFAGLAILLAAIGSYGVLSYMVTERRREIGIRMALGADRASVLRMVLSQGLRLTVLGVLAGLTAAFAMSRVLGSLLFGVKPTDPLTIAAVVGLISAVALAACYLPARGATRVDPMLVLRED